MRRAEIRNGDTEINIGSTETDDTLARLRDDESGIIVFGGGGSGCSGRGCLFWILVSIAASVVLTVLANLVLLLLS